MLIAEINSIQLAWTIGFTLNATNTKTDEYCAKNLNRNNGIR